jgi:hypothetical protein
MSRRAPHSPEYVNGKVVSAVDWRGNRFRVGDEVMYCISAGRGQMMAVGVVLTIKVEQLFHSKDVEADAEDEGAFTRPWFDPNQYYRTIKVPYDEITVQVRTLKTSGRWDNKERTKPAWVNPMNITAPGPVRTP